MKSDLTKEALIQAGVSGERADRILEALGKTPKGQTADRTWSHLSRSVLAPELPFPVHLLLHRAVFGNWDPSQGPPPAWCPTNLDIENSNIQRFCQTLGISPIASLHAWSVRNREKFWAQVIESLGIEFQTPPSTILDPASGVESARWLAGAKLNIADSCFWAKKNQTAVIFQPEGGSIGRLSYAELDRVSNRFANSLGKLGIRKGEAIAIAMTMTWEAVAAYLGILKAGCVVVSIADSFAPEEIATRLRIARATTVVTQDVILRAGKTLPMYAKVVRAGAARAIVVHAGERPAVDLRSEDRTWDDFLVDDDRFASIAGAPDDPINVLFSSGTTGEPKAIPWNHSTAIKCAMDGYLHQNLRPGEVVAWPTNLGWMMGPWLIFAALINRGTIALYYGAPNSVEFCRFVQDANVQMLGVVPSLVKAWRSADMVTDLDWTAIDCFSSTGEASNSEEMLFLMSRAGYRPVIEYCGGTEIGGGYLTGSIVRPASPATFSTPAFGLDLQILDDSGRPADTGELFLVPPSIGLSNTLLNRDHHEVYYQDTPKGPDGELLRRHGDQVERLPGGFFRAQGRADDTMNLGGIKVSSAEIERTVSQVEGVRETAAIACDPAGGGPSILVVYAVLEAGEKPDTKALKIAMQQLIKTRLNPLFRVHEVVTIDTLPRTASNKVMRRVLRDRYRKPD